MKNYDQLTPEQKTKVLDKAKNSVIANISSGKKHKLSKSVKKKLTTTHHLCGCFYCFRDTADLFDADSEFREFVITEAYDMLEGAFFSEDDDYVFDI